jgi:hypothetical protein
MYIVNALEGENLVWESWLVESDYGRLSFTPLGGGTSIICEIGSYTGYFYPLGHILLVASNAHLLCFGAQAQLIWQSGCLGIDGVVVNEVKNGVIYGEGEYDPPGGWKPFQLDFPTGKHTSKR